MYVCLCLYCFYLYVFTYVFDLKLVEDNSGSRLEVYVCMYVL